MYTKRYLQNSIEELKELEIEKDNLEKRIKKKQEAFKRYMSEMGISELNGLNGERITYSQVVGKKFCVSDFKKKYSYLYELFQIPTTTYRFKFTY